MNSDGEFLISQREGWQDGMWQTTGGAAVRGDDSLTAALRETKEELGIGLDPTKGELMHRIARRGDDGHTWFQDAWMFEHDCPIESVRFQAGETRDAMRASKEKIKQMGEEGTFLWDWYPYIDEMMEKWE